jgi:uncharacterized protein (TIGR02246 family)
MHEAVQDLVGRYCEAVLRNDAAIFADVWEPDAVWCIPGARIVEGRSAIVSTFARIRRGYSLCVQQILNSVIEPQDDAEARARFQVRELQWRPDGSGSELIGIYHDVISVDQADRARFKRRDFELLYDGPVDLPGRLRSPRPPQA